MDRGAPVRGSVRDLSETVALASAGVWLLLGLSGSVCLGVLFEDYALLALWALVALGTGLSWRATRSLPAGPRWGLRLAWVPFVTVLLPGQPWLPWATAPLWAAPFVWGVVRLVSSHVRPGSAPWRRVRTDGALIGALLLPVWLAPVHATLEELLFPLFLKQFWGVLLLPIAGLGCVLALLLRARGTARALDPGERDPVWDALADDARWMVTAERDLWVGRVQLGEQRLQIAVEHDPVPVQTRLRLELPALRGLTVTRGTSALGDPVLDGHLSVQGEGGLEVLTRARGAWLQVVHGWGGALREGVLEVTLDGDDPRRWVRLPEGAEARDALEQVLATLAELSPEGEPQRRETRLGHRPWTKEGERGS